MMRWIDMITYFGRVQETSHNLCSVVRLLVACFPQPLFAFWRGKQRCRHGS